MSLFSIRNFQSHDEKSVKHDNSNIISWKETWEQFNDEKKKWENKSNVVCAIYREGSINQPLLLGECNDGSKFTSINQSINQAKEFIEICNKNGW